LATVANARTHPTSAQLRRALVATSELAELRRLEDYPARAVSLLHSLIPCDIASYNAVDPVAATASVVVDPAESLFAGGAELLAGFAHQNPLISHYASTGDGHALRISDFVNRRQFHNTDLYDHVYRPIDVEYQMAITVPSPRRGLGRPGELVGLTLSRTRRDFSESERTLLDFVRPHFTATLARLHELALLRAIGDAAQADGSRWLMLVAADGTVAWANRMAVDGIGAAVGQPLAAGIRSWIGEARAQVRHGRLRDGTLSDGHPRGGTPSDGRPRGGTPSAILEHEGFRLRAQLVADAYPQLDGLWLTPMAELPGPEALRALGLTRRQAEVLALVLEGRTSAQVAQTLVLSTRTVEKHLEAIYARLGVENRGQAIAAAIMTMVR
jgi:DNA-binding CsgD family transcriptional regulator